MTDYNLDGLELLDLSADFEPIVGFLNTPGKNDVIKGTAKPMTFQGVIKASVPTTDQNGREGFWLAIEATADQKCTYYDKETEETHEVKKGDLVGVSGKGAIKGLKDKIGHFVNLAFTAKLKTVKNGEMLEVLTKVSKDPVTVKAPTNAKSGKAPAQARA